MPLRQHVLFNRHALAYGDSAKARLMLDVKRVYLELEGSLK